MVYAIRSTDTKRPNANTMVLSFKMADVLAYAKDKPNRRWKSVSTMIAQPAITTMIEINNAEHKLSCMPIVMLCP